MLASIFNTFRRNFWNPTEPRESRKRQREERDESEPGELAKRLRSMTESRMTGCGRCSTSGSQASLASHSSSSDEVEILSPTGEPERPRLCLPRRPGRRLTDPPRAPLTDTRQIPTARSVPIVVEKDVAGAVARDAPVAERRGPVERRVPVVVEGAAAAARRPDPAKAAPGADGTDDDVVVIDEKVSNGDAPRKGSSAGFVGLRSFRQMLETGRVAGRASPFKRCQQQQKQTTPAQSSLYKKLIGIAPVRMSSSKRGMATLHCFRLEEKKRYQQLLANLSSVSPPSSVDDLPSFRTRSLMASTPLEPAAALRRDRLDPAATSRLQRRVSTIDLTSSGSEASQTRPPPPPPPPQRGATVNLASSGSESCSRQASVVSDSDASVVIEKVVPAPPRRKTQLDEDIDRHLKHFSEIREKYAASERDRERQIMEEERRGAESRVNHLEWERRLTERLRRQMRLTQRVALEAEPELPEEEEEEPLPELTAQMESTVSAALRASPPDELMSEAFNQRITRHDLQTLKGLNWLNDEVINFYMSLIMERSKANGKFPKVYCFNTFFYGKIVSQGQSSVKRWTRKVDIFAHDLLMIPVHLGMHWCLACVDLRNKTVRYFDSMSGNNNKGLDAILRYLRDEHADKKKTPLDTSDWEAINEKDIPQQMNGSDCGMFACKFAEYLSRDAKITFTQENMPYFRRRMIYEIISKALL